MSQAKKKPPIMKAKPNQETNKKALIWIGSILAVIIVVIAVLLIIDN